MSVRLVENVYGRLRMWKKPHPSKKYVIGADVAEGISRSDEAHAGVTDRDYSAATVIELDSADLVAAWMGRLPSNEFAMELDRLGSLYNWALLAVEVNNQGISTVHSLEVSEYPNLYLPSMAKHPSSHDYIGLKNKGWVTSRTTKPLIIDAIREALASGYSIPWETLLRQMESMEMDPKTGSARAPYGMHDDAVMAYGITLCVREEHLISGDDFDGLIGTNLDPDTKSIFRILRKMQNAEKERVDDV